jgi:hypothetical protein
MPLGVKMSEETFVNDEEVELPTETESEAESETEQETETEVVKKESGVQKRIDELTREKYQARQRAEQIERENESLRAFLQQQVNNEVPRVDIEELVKQEATRQRETDRFNEACNKTYDLGQKEFNDFDATVSNLQVVGVTPQFLDLVASSDAGHKVLHYLGTHLEEADKLIRMPPHQMGRALAILEMNIGNSKQKVSKVPPPITPLSGKTVAGKKDPAVMTDDEYMKWRRSAK